MHPRFDQLGGPLRVQPNRWFACATMRAKPVAEGRHQRRLDNLLGGEYGVTADPDTDQMAVKELYSEPCVVARISAAAPSMPSSERLPEPRSAHPFGRARVKDLAGPLPERDHHAKAAARGTRDRGSVQA